MVGVMVDLRAAKRVHLSAHMSVYEVVAPRDSWKEVRMGSIAVALKVKELVYKLVAMRVGETDVALEYGTVDYWELQTAFLWDRLKAVLLAREMEKLEVEK